MFFRDSYITKKKQLKVIPKCYHCLKLNCDFAVSVNCSWHVVHFLFFLEIYMHFISNLTFNLNWKKRQLSRSLLKTKLEMDKETKGATEMEEGGIVLQLDPHLHTLHGSMFCSGRLLLGGSIWEWLIALSCEWSSQNSGILCICKYKQSQRSTLEQD